MALTVSGTVGSGVMGVAERVLRAFTAFFEGDVHPRARGLSGAADICEGRPDRRS